jgi:ribosomal protein S18 acetylase RimI-like enzyme
MAKPLSVIFRKATQRDVPRLTELYNECFAKWITASETPAYMSKMVADGDFNVIVAEDKPGHMAGFIVANSSFSPITGAVNIDVMAVDEKSRRSGLGRGLMHMGEMVARNAEARGLTLQVVEYNEPAKRLYLSIGFNIIGKRPGYYRDGAAAFEMFKKLPPAETANDDLAHPAVQRPKRRRGFF